MLNSAYSPTHLLKWQYTEKCLQGSVRRVLSVAIFCGICVWLILATAPVNAKSNGSSYILGTGDKVRVTVFGQPDLSGEFTIGATGSLSLPLIGTVSTAGEVSSTLEKAIIKKLKDGYLKKPTVTVEVIGYRPFYILGDVKSPGSFPYVNGMTVLNAIVLAGGYLVSPDEAVQLRLQLTLARERLNILRGQYRAAIGREARLITERDKGKSIKFPEELTRLKADPAVAKIIDGEIRFFTTRQEALSGGISVLRREQSQILAVISASKAELEAANTQLRLVRAELTDYKKLLDKGYARKTQYSQQLRNAAEIESRRLGAISRIAGAKQDSAKLDVQIVNLRNGYLNEVVNDLQTVQNRISGLKESLQSASEVMRQREAKAGQANAKLLDKSAPSIKITRNTAQGPREIEASEYTRVFPGDIIKIPSLIGLTDRRLER